MSAEQDTDHGMAFVSAPPDQAERLARQIVEARLAACAQVLPSMTSIYWWKSELQSEPERLIMLKIRRSLLPELEALLSRIHPYELPELTFVRFDGAAERYRQWMDDVLR